MGRGNPRSAGRFGGRSYGGCGESQFGGAAEEDSIEPPERRHLTAEEYWRRHFGTGNYQGRMRGEDTGDRFVPPEAPRGGAWHRMAGPSRHPLAPRNIQRSNAQLYEDSCEALLRREDVDCSDVTVAVSEGEVTLEGSVPERNMRYLIEDLAAGHPAVKGVDNRIRVRKG